MAMPLRFPHAARAVYVARRISSLASPPSSPSSFSSTSSSPSSFLAPSTHPCATASLRPQLHHASASSISPITRRHCSSSSSHRSISMANLENQPPKEVRKYLQQSHDRIFENNKKWAEEQKAKHPEFFENLSAGQSPDYLWIGCSDSRIPAEAITGLGPGEMFIHRNIANLVCNTDLNVMSVVNYAVRHLKVKHIVVCGHYGCGGVKAAMTPQDLGLLNPWLRNIRDVYRLYEAELDAITDENDRYNRLVELNVIEQCRNIIKTAAVQQSFAKNDFPVVHGWVFGFSDGLLKDLKFDFEGQLKSIQKIYDLTKGA